MERVWSTETQQRMRLIVHIFKRSFIREELYANVVVLLPCRYKTHLFAESDVIEDSGSKQRCDLSN
jgi:hypothetical protein